MEAPNYEEAGENLLKSGNFEEAIKVYDAAIKLSPNNPEYHFKIGIAFESTGKLQEALREFKTATSLDSSNSKYHGALGRLLLDLKEFGESQVEIDKAIALDPKDADYHIERAKLLSKNEKYQEALAEIKIAEEFNPNSVSLHLSKSSILFALKRYENAIQELDIAISLEPRNPQAHADKALNLEHQGRYEDAIREYDAAIELNPEDPEIYVSKSAVLRGMKKYNEANDELEKAIKLEPNNPRYLRFKFDILEDKRKFEDFERTKKTEETKLNYDKNARITVHDTVSIPSFKDLSNFEYLLTKTVPERILLNGAHYIQVAFFVTNLRVGITNLDGSGANFIWYQFLTSADVGRFKMPHVPTGATGLTQYVGAKIGQTVATSIILGINRDALNLTAADGTWMSIKDKSAQALLNLIKKVYTNGKEVSLLLLQAQEKEKDHDLVGTLNLFKKAVELDPQIPNAEYVEGNLEYVTGEYGRALTKLEAAAEKAPNDSSVILLLADCYYALQKFSQASRTVEEHIARGLNPSRDLITKKPLYDLFAGKIDLALEEAERHVRSEPADSETVAIYAAACAASGSKEVAFTNLSQAVKFSPDKRTKFSVYVAKGFMMANDRVSAARIVNESLTFDPANTELIELKNQLGEVESSKDNEVKSLIDSYKILGLQQGVGKEIIEAVYQTLVKQYHPDSNAGATPAVKKIAEEKMKEITEAYKEVMSHLN